jgi:dihydroceramidase
VCVVPFPRGLLQPADLVAADELSMHLLITPLIYRSLTFKASPQFTMMVGIGVSVMFTIVMVTHMVLDEFLLHATTFGLGVYFIASRSLVIIQQSSDAMLRRKLRIVTFLGIGRSTARQALERCC